MALIKLILLLTTVRTQLPRVLGRHEHPTAEPLTLWLNRLFEVKVTTVSAVRQLLLHLLV